METVGRIIAKFKQWRNDYIRECERRDELMRNCSFQCDNGEIHSFTSGDGGMGIISEPCPHCCEV